MKQRLLIGASVLLLILGCHKASAPPANVQAENCAGQLIDLAHQVLQASECVTDSDCSQNLISAPCPTAAFNNTTSPDQLDSALNSYNQSCNIGIVECPAVGSNVCCHFGICSPSISSCAALEQQTGCFEWTLLTGWQTTACATGPPGPNYEVFLRAQLQKK